MMEGKGGMSSPTVGFLYTETYFLWMASASSKRLPGHLRVLLSLGGVPDNTRCRVS